MSASTRNQTNDLDSLQRAASLFQQGVLQEARVLAESIAPASRFYPDAIHLQGTIQYQLGDYERALELLTKARHLNPDNLQLLNTLASCHHALGDTKQAMALYEFVLQHAPQYDDARKNLAITQHAAGLLDKALNNLGKVRAKLPAQSVMERLYAQWLHEGGNSIEAETVLVDVCNLFPHDPENFNQLGTLYSQSLCYGDAIDAFERALALKPEHVPALLNLAFAQQQRGEFVQAKALYERALNFLGCKPQETVTIRDIKSASSVQSQLIAKARYNLAIVNLTLGDYETGWRNYCARPSLLRSQRELCQEILPMDLTGKHVLVLRDQGLGDELFFLRYACMIESRGGAYEYSPHGKLRPLLEQCSDVKLLDGERTSQKTVDYVVSVADLPYALGIATPLSKPLELVPHTDNTKAILTKLHAAGPAPYIGVTWRAGSDNEDNEVATTWRKRIELEEIKKQLQGFKGTLCILQRNPQAEEIAWIKENFACSVTDFSACNDDLVSMLSLLASLDNYVGVSNTNLHLRGSLGLNADVFVPFPPEWRWKNTGAESIWYPSFMLHRQNEDGTWPDAAIRI